MPDVKVIKAALEAAHVPELMERAFPSYGVTIKGRTIYVGEQKKPFARFDIKAGRWIERVSGEGGDVLNLLALALTGSPDTGDKGTFIRVMREAEAITGLGERSEGTQAYQDRLVDFEAKAAAQAEARKTDEAKEAAEAANLTAAALKLMKPIKGTPAAECLKSRGIHALSPPSDVVGYVEHKGNHLLVLIGRDRTGTPMSYQAIQITEDGSKAEVDVPKRTHGKIGIAPIKIPATTEDARLFICEGPETALTIHKVTGAETWAVTGASLFAGLRGKHDIDPARDILLCPDADAVGSQAWLAFDKGWKEWLTCQNPVYIVHSGYEAGSKADLNDLIMARGPAAVKRAIARANPIHVPINVARDRVGRVIGDFSYGNMQRLYVGVGVGIGKTQAAVEKVLATIDLRTQFAVYASPMHSLNDQTAEEIRALRSDIRVASRRGADAINPETGGKMCLNLDEFREYSQMMLDTASTVCSECDFANDCAYLAQEQMDGHIYQLSHSRLAGAKGIVARAAAETESRAARELAAYVVDESFSPAPAKTHVTIGALYSAPCRSEADIFGDDAAFLRASRARLAQMITENFNPNERILYITRGMVQGAFGSMFHGVDADEGMDQLFADNIRAEWARKYEPPMFGRPDINLARHNMTVRPMARIWSMLREFMATESDASARLFIKQYREEAAIGGVYVPKLDVKTPLLALDATGSIHMQEAVIGAAYTHAVQIYAQQPNLWIEQDWTQSFSQSWAKQIGADDRSTASNNVDRLVSYLREQADLYDGDTLVVANMKLEMQLKGRVPSNMTLRHFNDLRGDNSFKNFKRAIIIGRPMPSTDAVEDFVRAYQDRTTIGEFGYVTRYRPVIQPDGGVKCDRIQMRGYPDDEFANEVIEQIAAAELIQTTGRLRAVNTSEPVMITVLGDMLLQVGYEALPVHPVGAPWKDRFKRCPITEQLASGGVAFLSGANAVRAYPRIFSSTDAARKALSRHGRDCPKCAQKQVGQTPIIETWLKQQKSGQICTQKQVGQPPIRVLIGGCPTCSGFVEFRKAGSKGGHTATAITTNIATAKADIERLLGFEIETIQTKGSGNDQTF